MLYDWSLWGRSTQQTPPGNWVVWLNLSGRGAGKTRTGAETIRRWANELPPGSRISLVGETAADARDVLVEGESGILSISPRWNRPRYYSSKRRVEWPNGTYALLFSGDDPDQLRGPQCHKAWVDELAKYRYAQETWDNLELGLRLGSNPQVVVTTTPRPIKLIKNLLKDRDTHVTIESTYANIANLPERFIQRIIRKYEGTRLGRQELHAEVLDDVVGALWTLAMFDRSRWPRDKPVPPLRRVVVAIDPSGTMRENVSETGIVVAGVGPCRCKGAIEEHGFVLEDLTGPYSPEQWGTLAVRAYGHWRADAIVGEVNYGGDMVEANVRAIDRTVKFVKVHATRGKFRRAEPISSLYEQGRVHHVGSFSQMEDQMCTWTAEDDAKPKQASPNNMDGTVWALTELMINPKKRKKVRLAYPGRRLTLGSDGRGEKQVAPR